MNILGMNVGKYRLPLYEMEDGAKEYLVDAIEGAAGSGRDA